MEEKDRAQTSSSRENGSQAVMIEAANDEIGGDWHVSGKLIYYRRREWKFDNSKRSKSDTECPGPYLSSKMPEIAEAVNQRLSADNDIK